MSKPINHEPTITARELLQATISILQGELNALQGDEATQEELDRLVSELGYAQQQLLKRLADPGIRCACGARLEQVSANGLHCPHCGFYRRMTDEEYTAIQRQHDLIRASNQHLSQPDLSPAPAPPLQLVVREEAKAIAKKTVPLAFNPDDYPCPVCGQTRCPGVFNPIACVNTSPAPLGVTCQVIGCKSSNAIHCRICGAWLCSYHLGLRYHAYDLKQRQGSRYVEPNHLPIWAEE